MAAFGLTLSIFLLWSVIGFSLVSALNGRRNLLRNALLAPAVGTATTVILMLWSNLAGLPIRRAGPPITACLLVAAIFLLRRIHPLLPVRRLRPFLVVLLASAVLTGYPMFRFGFDWMSYCNDDMANYSLAAKFFLNHGFFEMPSLNALIHDRDVSLFYWFMYGFGGVRPGCEEVIAWVCSLTGLSPHQAYMATIVAIQLVLISAVAALMVSNRRYRMVSVITAGWVGVSALVALGTMYQLIAQVLGLSLLTAVSTTLLRPAAGNFDRTLVRRCILSGILAGALCIAYPETIPFLGLAFVIYHVLLLAQKRESWKALRRTVLWTALTTVLLLGVYLPGSMATIGMQLNNGFRRGSASDLLFPYYLLPSGFANLWGFLPMAASMSHPLLDVNIVFGAALFLFCLLSAIWQAWRGYASAVLFLIMGGLSMQLFRTRADFGLYKIAMYMQPFLIATAVLGWYHIVMGNGRLQKLFSGRRTVVLAVPLFVPILAGMTGQVYYVMRSFGGAGSGFLEIPGASGARLVSHLLRAAKGQQGVLMLSDSTNVVLGKFEALYFPALFPHTDYFGQVIGFQPEPLLERLERVKDPELRIEAQALVEERRKQFATLNFNMRGAIKDAATFQARQQTIRAKAFSLLETGPAETVLNRRRFPLASEAVEFRIESSAWIRNHLLFVPSDVGMSYYGAGGRASEGRVSMYQLERDYFFPGLTMASLGRDSVYRIINPTPEVRLVVEYTASLNADGQDRIPAASVIGMDRLALPARGRGSARLFSPVIEPQIIDGAPYVALDMGTWGDFFPDRRAGVMRLYGTGIRIDARRTVGFVRDISALSEEEYHALRPPRSLSRFPGDLSNRDLEYSGIYEDGWIGESAFVVLQQGAEPSVLLVRLVVPMIQKTAASSFLVVSVDGKEVSRQRLTAGANSLTVPVAASVGRRRVDLQFNGVRSLPAPDTRPVSAQVEFIGFQDGSKIPATGHSAR